MTLEELRQALDDLGVPPSAYVLDGPPGDECYVLRRLGDGWTSFYAERGLRTNERTFATESEAAAAFFRRLRRDLGR